MHLVLPHTAAELKQLAARTVMQKARVQRDRVPALQQTIYFASAHIETLNPKVLSFKKPFLYRQLATQALNPKPYEPRQLLTFSGAVLGPSKTLGALGQSQGALFGFGV